MNEKYTYNGITYTREELEQRYGDRTDEAIKKFGMKPVAVYEYNGKQYDYDELQQRYGDRTDEAIKKFGIKKKGDTEVGGEEQFIESAGTGSEVQSTTEAIEKPKEQAEEIVQQDPQESVNSAEYDKYRKQRELAVRKLLDDNYNESLNELKQMITPEKEAAIQNEYERVKSQIDRENEEIAKKQAMGMPFASKQYPDYAKFRDEFIESNSGMLNSTKAKNYEEKLKSRANTPTYLEAMGIEESELPTSVRNMYKGLVDFSSDKKVVEPVSRGQFGGIASEAMKPVDVPKHIQEKERKKQLAIYDKRFGIKSDTEGKGFGGNYLENTLRGASLIGENGVDFYVFDKPQVTKDFKYIDAKGNKSGSKEEAEANSEGAKSLIPVDYEQRKVFRNVIEEFIQANPNYIKDNGSPEEVKNQRWDSGDFKFEKDWDALKDFDLVSKAFEYQYKLLGKEYTDRVAQMEKQFAKQFDQRDNKNEVLPEDYEMLKTQMLLQYNTAEQYLKQLYGGYVRAAIKSPTMTTANVEYAVAQRDIKAINKVREQAKREYDNLSTVGQVLTDVRDGVSDGVLSIMSSAEGISNMIQGDGMSDERKRDYAFYRASNAGSEDSFIREASNLIFQSAAIMYPAFALGGALKGAGMAAKFATPAGITTSTYLQVTGNAYQDALDRGYSYTDALIYGNTMGASMGLVESIIPAEFLYTGTRKSITDGVVKILKNADPKQLNMLSAWDVFNMSVKEFVKDAKGEAAEELLSLISEKAINLASNTVFDGEDFDTQITSDEVLGAIGGSAVVSTFFGVPRLRGAFRSRNALPLQIKYEGLAAENSDIVYKKLEDAKKEGALSDIEYSNAKKRLDDLVEQKRKVDAITERRYTPDERRRMEVIDRMIANNREQLKNPELSKAEIKSLKKDIYDLRVEKTNIHNKAKQMDEFSKNLLTSIRSDVAAAEREMKGLDESDPVDAATMNLLTERIVNSKEAQNNILNGENSWVSYLKYLGATVEEINEFIEGAPFAQREKERMEEEAGLMEAFDDAVSKGMEQPVVEQAPTPVEQVEEPVMEVVEPPVEVTEQPTEILETDEQIDDYERKRESAIASAKRIITEALGSITELAESLTPRSERVSKTKEKQVIRSIAPRTLEELAMKYFLHGGKVNTDSLVSELGLKRKTKSGYVEMKSEKKNMLGKYAKNAKTIEAVAEDLALDEDGIFGYEIDVNDMRGAIISVLGMKNSDMEDHFRQYVEFNGMVYESEEAKLIAEEEYRMYESALSEYEAEVERIAESILQADEYRNSEDYQEYIKDSENLSDVFDVSWDAMSESDKAKYTKDLEQRVEQLEKQLQDAVQEQKTDEVDVRQQAEDGEALGKRDTKRETTKQGTKESPKVEKIEAAIEPNEAVDVQSLIDKKKKVESDIKFANEELNETKERLSIVKKGGKKAEKIIKQQREVLDRLIEEYSQKGEDANSLFFKNSYQEQLKSLNEDPVEYFEKELSRDQDRVDRYNSQLSEIDKQISDAKSGVISTKETAQKLDFSDVAIDSPFKGGVTVTQKTKKSDLNKLKENATATQRAIIDSLPNILRAFKKSGIKGNIVLHGDAESFNKAMRDAGVEENVGVAGMFDVDGNIHINLQSGNVTKGTLIHEAVHAVVSSHIGNNPELLSKYAKQLRTELRSISPSLALELDEFVNQYPESERDEEFVAEFIAMVADGYIDLNKLDPPKRNKVINFFRNILKAFGIDGKVVITDATDAIQFARAMDNALSGGLEIQTKIRRGEDVDTRTAKQQKWLERQNVSRTSKGLPPLGKKKTREQELEQEVRTFLKDNPDFKNEENLVRSFIARQMGIEPKPKLQMRLRGMNPEMRQGLESLAEKAIRDGYAKDQIIDGLKEQGLAQSSANTIYSAAKNNIFKGIPKTNETVKKALRDLRKGIDPMIVMSNVIDSLPDNEKKLAGYYYSVAFNNFVNNPTNFKELVKAKTDAIRERAARKREESAEKRAEKAKINRARKDIRSAVAGKGSYKKVFANEKQTLKMLAGIQYTRLSEASQQIYKEILFDIHNSIKAQPKVTKVEDEFVATKVRRKYSNEDLNGFVDEFKKEIEDYSKKMMLERLSEYYGQLGMVMPEEYGDLNLDELKAIVNDIFNPVDSEDVSKESERALRVAALTDLAANYIGEIQQAVSSGELDISDFDDNQKKVYGWIMNGYPSELSENDLKTLINGLDNLLMNGSVDGLGNVATKMIAPAIADKIVKEFEKKKIKFSRLDFVERTLGSIDLIFERLGKGVDVGAMLMNETGVSNIFAGGSRANRLVEDYLKKAGKIEKKFRNVNTAEGQIAAYFYGQLLGNYGGTDVELANEMKRRIDLYRSSSTILANSRGKSKKQQGELELDIMDAISNSLMEAADLVIQGEMTANEMYDILRSNMKRNGYEGSMQVAELAMSYFAEQVDKFDNMVRMYDNRELERSYNYLPSPTVALKGGIKEEESITQGSGRSSRANLPRSSKERLRFINALDKKKNRVYDTNFFAVTTKALREQAMTNEILASERLFSSVIDTDLMAEAMGEDTQKFIKTKISKSLRIIRRLPLSDSWFSQGVGKFGGAIGNFSTTITLGGVTQLVKQVPSVGTRFALFNIMRGKSPLMISEGLASNTFLSGIQYHDGIFEKSDLLERIKTEGGLRQTFIEDDIKKGGDNAAKRVVRKFYDVRSGMRKAQLAALTKSDAWIAKRTWLTFYAEGLLKESGNGISKYSDIDWQEQSDNPSEYASTYASMMVSRAQNVNDVAKASNLMMREGDYKDLFKSIFFPFASFSFNSMATRYVNIKNFVNAAGRGDLAEVKTSLADFAGIAAEAVVFNSVKAAISAGRYYIVYEIVKDMLGYNDDEMEEIMNMPDFEDHLQIVFAQSLVDLTIGGIPFVESGMKIVLNNMYQNGLIPFFEPRKKTINGKDVDDTLIYLTNNSGYSFADQLGLFGIAFDQYAEVLDAMSAYIDDEYHISDKWGEADYEISDRHKNAISLYLAIKALPVLVGITDSDVNTMSNTFLRAIKRDIKNTMPKVGKGEVSEGWD